MPASYKASDFLHPLDLAARQQLDKVPGLELMVKKYRGLVADRKEHQFLLCNAVRMSRNQLPEFYRLLPPICEAFGIAEPALYLIRGPANAMTWGHAAPTIIINSDLLEDLSEQEVQAVIAHECGHILAEHVLYRQMALALLGGATGVAGALGPTIGAVASLASEPLKTALLNWYQKSELTADRAAVAFMKGPETLQSALFHILGVPKWWPGRINLAEFTAQAEEYEKIVTSSKWERHLMRSLQADSTHPLPVVRLREMQEWADSSTFKQLLAIAQSEATDAHQVCPACGHTVLPDWRFCQHCGNRSAALDATSEPVGEPK